MEKKLTSAGADKLIKAIMDSKVSKIKERMQDKTPVAITLSLGQWMHLAYLGFTVEKSMGETSNDLMTAIELLRRQVRDAAKLTEVKH